jgi:hypothetical protein
VNLTGFWTGTYWYYVYRQPVVPFLANVDDHGGRLAGSISEPDIHMQTGVRIEAFLVGECEGMRVTFAKVYDGAGPFAHRVDYTGSLSDDGKSLTGSWYLSGDWGGFEMTRQLLENEELAEDKILVSAGWEADLK